LSDLYYNQSIYPECVTRGPSGEIVKLEIPVELGEPRKILVDNGATTNPLFSSNGVMTPSIPLQSEELTLSSLPPLLIHLILPSNYPLHAPPEIVSLRATHSWFSRLDDLRHMLLDMWQGEGVLYNWVELIRTAEFLNIELDHNNIAIRYGQSFTKPLGLLLT
jgi:E3 ubiquitin-protein ligase RNF14